MRQRRDTARILTINESLLIELEMTRLRFKLDELKNWKAAFRLNQKSLPGPSADRIADMRNKVEVISRINAANRTAKAIVRAAMTIAWNLRSVTLN